MVIEVSIIPKGVKATPVFKSREDFERYRDDFYRDVAPKLKELERARVRSWERAANKIYY